MNRKTGFQLAVALLAVVAIGVSATTFESTVKTDANDVIDLEYDRVPIGQEHAAEVVDRVERTREAQNADQTAQSQSDTGESPSSSSADSVGGGGSSADPRPSQEVKQQQANEQAKQNAESEVPSPVDDLLATLLALLPTLLVLAAFLAVVTLIVHYGPRLDEHRDDAGDEESGGPGAGEIDEWPGRPPANAVDRAWVSMVSRLDLTRPTTRTPNECAAAAIEAGLDRETVETLTDAFVAVRYGERPVTERRERVARQSRRRFDGEKST